MTTELMLPKSTAIKTIEALPDNSSLEDIIESLCVIQDVEEGLRDADEGLFVADEDIVQKFNL